MAENEALEDVKQKVNGPLKELKIKQKQNEIFKYLAMRESGEMTKDDFCDLLHTTVELDQLLTGSNTPIPKIFIDEELNSPDPADRSDGLHGVTMGYQSGSGIGINPSVYDLFMVEGNPNATPEMIDEAYKNASVCKNRSALTVTLDLIGHEFQHQKQQHLAELVKQCADKNPKISDFYQLVIRDFTANNTEIIRYEDVDLICDIMAYKNTVATEDKYSDTFVDTASNNRSVIASRVSHGSYAMQAHEVDARMAGIGFCKRISQSLEDSENFEQFCSSATKSGIKEMKNDILTAELSEIIKWENMKDAKRFFNKGLRNFGEENIKKMQEEIDTGLRGSTQTRYNRSLDIIRNLTYDEMSKKWTDEQFVDNYVDVLLSSSSVTFKFSNTFREMPKAKQEKISKALNKKVFDGLVSANCRDFAYNIHSQALSHLSDKDKEKLFETLLSKKMYVPLLSFANNLGPAFLKNASTGFLKNCSKFLDIVLNDETLKFLQTQNIVRIEDVAKYIIVDSSSKKDPFKQKQLKYLIEQMGALKEETAIVKNETDPFAGDDFDEKRHEHSMDLQKAAAKLVASTCSEKYYASTTFNGLFPYKDIKAEIAEDEKKAQEAQQKEKSLKSKLNEVKEEAAPENSNAAEAAVENNPAEMAQEEYNPHDPFDNVGYNEISDYVPKPEKELDNGLEQKK